VDLTIGKEWRAEKEADDHRLHRRPTIGQTTIGGTGLKHEADHVLGMAQRISVAPVLQVRRNGQAPDVVNLVACAPLLARPRAIRGWSIAPFGCAVRDAELLDAVMTVVALRDEVDRALVAIRVNSDVCVDVDSVRHRDGKRHVRCESQQQLRSLRGPASIQQHVHVNSNAVLAGMVPGAAREQLEA
jgi:hypothetical protein